MAGNGIGRWLIVVGLALAVVGVLLILAEKWPGFGSLFGWIGKLPGDLSFKREQFSVYIPIATMIGDRSLDIEAGNAAGVETIYFDSSNDSIQSVKTSNATKNVLLTNEPTHIIHELTE